MAEDFMQNVLANVDSVSWERIIDIGAAIEFKIKTEEEQLSHMKKELNAMKIVLSERLKYSTNVGSFDPKMIMDIIALLERVEAISSQYEVDVGHFRTYLHIVLEKLKKEKFGAHKTAGKDFGKSSPQSDKPYK